MRDYMKILVVDDDEKILELFKDFFDAEGHSVLSARDGVEAMELCHQNKVDFCFTDLCMPRMDGIEFARRIQALDNTIPVVVMTGYPSTDNAIATLRNGVIDFLVKPFKIQEIERVIQNSLGRRELFVEKMLLKEKSSGKRRLARLDQELFEKGNDLDTLNVILERVDWITSSADLFDLIVRLCARITSSDEAHFFTVDDTAGRPTPIASFCADGNGGRHHSRTCFEIENVLADRRPYDTPLLMTGGDDDGLLRGGIRSLIAMPFKIREKVFGVLAAVVKGGSVDFTEKDLYYLSFMAKRAGSAIENLALYENLHQNLFATLYALVEAIEARDPYTKRHSSRVSKLALSIGKEMGCSNDELDLLNFSGNLHDIGKIGIRDSILLKPGPLTEQELAVIKEHPVIGANIIGHVGLLCEEQKIIRHHHEQWDGKGYPDGLKGESVPFLSRILSVADIYDAMASNRAYRKKIPEKVILDVIGQDAGSKFDEDVVRGFVNVYERGDITSNEDRT